MGLRTHMPPPLPHTSPCRAHKPTWPLRRCFAASRAKPQMCEFVCVVCVWGGENLWQWGLRGRHVGGVRRRIERLVPRFRMHARGLFGGSPGTCASGVIIAPDTGGGIILKLFARPSQLCT